MKCLFNSVNDGKNILWKAVIHIAIEIAVCLTLSNFLLYRQLLPC